MDEAWGFDLGLRDRQGNNTTLWKPAGCQEMARSPKDVHPLKRKAILELESLKWAQVEVS